VKGDGDGTVNIRSLKGCLKWDGAQKQAVHHKVFKGINHVDMLRREEPTSYVVDLIDRLNKQLQGTQVDEVRTSAEEGSLEAQVEAAALSDQVEPREVETGLLGPEDQEGDAEGGLLGDDEGQPDQYSGVEEEGSLNTHHGVFPIIEVSSGKK